MDYKEMILEGRKFTKYDDDENYKSDQDKKLPQPPLAKAAISEDTIDLPMNFEDLNLNNDIIDIFYFRASQRIFTGGKVSLLELSFLLWASQGVKAIRGNNYATIRTVPCGGARHEFETYLLVKNVEGLEKGIYHYLPMEDKIELLKTLEETDALIGKALMGQTWASKANVIFLWSLVPYRAEWRYGIFAHRVMMMDIGHVGENLYLACEAIGKGTCGLGAFDRKYCNELLDLSGDEEYTVYASPVGTINNRVKNKEFLSLKAKQKAETQSKE